MLLFRSAPLNCALIQICAIALGITSAPLIQAAGFQLKEQSAEGQGNSFAGQTAKAQDPGTVFYNPAGMTRLQGTQIEANLSYIAPSADYKHGSSSTAGTPFTNTRQDGAENGLVPSLFAVWGESEAVKFGLAVTVPFGLSTRYDTNWVGANANVKSEIKTLNIAPALAYRVTENLSLGASLQFNQVEGTLTRQVTTGLNTATASVIEADDTGWGYGLGLLWEYSDGGRIGLNYRSQIKHKLEGTVKVVGISTQNADTHITLPAIASLGWYQQLGSRWALLADLAWTDWSQLDQLVINNSDTGAHISTIDYFWQDTVFAALGANYQYSDKLQLKFGVAYDEGAASDAYRSAGIPDADRTWASVGATYQLTPATRLNIGYSHLFTKEASVSDSRTSAAVPTSYSGSFDSEVDILSLGLVMQF